MRCPHCKKVILSTAQQAVLRQARRPTPITALAFTYGLYRQSEHPRSWRRAVERMAVMGVLRRVKPGVYKAR